MEGLMPKTTSKEAAVDQAKAAQNGKPWTNKDAPRFVRCDLSPQQKVALTMWAADAEETDLLKWVEVRVTLGHVLSIRSNEVGFQCSLTGGTEGSGHLGVSLVARASTPLRAVYACWYRDEVVLEGKWPVSNTLDELDY
jgi:hypothetical protein